MGDFSEPPVSVESKSWYEWNVNAIRRAVVKATDACRVTVHIRLSDIVAFDWETVLIGRKLFVEVPKFILPDGSKESFVRLLEFAEDELECSHVIVCFKKDRSDRASLIRVFMFLGFTVLAPGNRLVPVEASDVVYLAYVVDDEDSSCSSEDSGPDDE